MQEPVFNSPTELLVSLIEHPESSPHLLLVTGPSGAGKTRWCQQLAEAARALDLDTAGLVSPAVFSADGKTQIDLLDLSTGQRRCLARRKTGRADWPSIGNWEFDPDGLTWGNQCLESVQTCQILIVDELGPLEFKDEAGLTGAFPLIAARQYYLACVAIRPTLLDAALARWPWAQQYVVPAREEMA